MTPRGNCPALPTLLSTLLWALRFDHQVLEFKSKFAFFIKPICQMSRPQKRNLRKREIFAKEKSSQKRNLRKREIFAKEKSSQKRNLRKREIFAKEKSSQKRNLRKREIFFAKEKSSQKRNLRKREIFAKRWFFQIHLSLQVHI